MIVFTNTGAAVVYVIKSLNRKLKVKLNFICCKTLRTAEERKQPDKNLRRSKMGKIYQVLVKGLKGETTTVDISQTEKEFNETTVLVFKMKLLTKLPQGTVQADDLRLLFANEQLEDDKRLSDYKVMDKSTIMMVLRLPGGGKCC
ncbi:uncharacterized protein LOC129703759 [Leucoraja erinacea]|uniref:uncharacterized protein LOC129703759 n=1 Tax=Leucoraja erinaceus TaxID=7782 RepID=UPI002456507E|nr:uncharacterized protein LOC129703759 [Leucoraja erinacea]